MDDDATTTLTDDEIEAVWTAEDRSTAARTDDADDTADTGDDSGDVSDTSDTGDDSGDTTDVADD